jgi:hypothetical protein
MSTSFKPGARLRRMNLKTLKKSILKLQEEAEAMAVKYRRKARRRACQGSTWEEIFHLLEESIAPESRPVLEDIMSQVAE